MSCKAFVVQKATEGWITLTAYIVGKRAHLKSLLHKFTIHLYMQNHKYIVEGYVMIRVDGSYFPQVHLPVSHLHSVQLQDADPHPAALTGTTSVACIVI